jgi:hypothetical protein
MLTYTTVVGGGLSDHTIPMALLDRKIASVDRQLRAALDGVELEYGTDWTWTEPNQLHLSAPLAEQHKLVVWRETRQDRPWVNPTPGAAMRAKDLSDYWSQLLYIFQELHEIVDLSDELGFPVAETFDAPLLSTVAQLHPDGGTVLSFSDLELLTGIPGAPSAAQHQIVVETLIDDVWQQLVLGDDYTVDSDDEEVTILSPGILPVRIRRVTKINGLWSPLADGYAFASAHLRLNERQLRFLWEECPLMPRLALGPLTNPRQRRAWNFLVYSGPGDRFTFGGHGWSGDGDFQVWVNDILLDPDDYTIDFPSFTIILNTPLEDGDIIVIGSSPTNWVVLDDGSGPVSSVPTPTDPTEPSDVDDLPNLEPVVLAPVSDSLASFDEEGNLTSEDFTVEFADPLTTGGVLVREVRIKYRPPAHNVASLTEAMLGFGYTYTSMGDVDVFVYPANSSWQIDPDNFTAFTISQASTGWDEYPIGIEDLVAEDGFIYLVIRDQGENSGYGLIQIEGVEEPDDPYPVMLNLNGAPWPSLLLGSVVVDEDAAIENGASADVAGRAESIGTLSIYNFMGDEGRGLLYIVRPESWTKFEVGLSLQAGNRDDVIIHVVNPANIIFSQCTWNTSKTSGGDSWNGAETYIIPMAPSVSISAGEWDTLPNEEFKRWVDVTALADYADAQGWELCLLLVPASIDGEGLYINSLAFGGMATDPVYRITL